MKRSIVRSVAPAFLLTTLLLGALAGHPALAHASSFSDVSESNPAHDAIESVVGRQLLTGFPDGTFRPEDPVLRGEATRILVSWRGLITLASAGVSASASAGVSVSASTGASASGPQSSFVDVSPADVTYVEAARAAGWLTGFPDGTFRPEDSLTREQVATMIIRALDLEVEANALPASRVDALLSRFSDEDGVSPTARPTVALAVSRGLFTGDSGRLSPLDPVTRAQLALMLVRAESPPGDQQQTVLADFMDRYLFRPHASGVTGAMVLRNTDWYGIPPLAQLVVMAAETSLGDPALGGQLARANNFGCLRYGGAGTPWGSLSSGSIRVAGRDWFAFPTPAIGMAALGRYLKSGVNGFYASILTAGRPDWARFAAVYYGRGVSGYGSYVSRLYAIESGFRMLAAAQGVGF